jgi:membrane-bound lytic murein transglycosylase
LRIDWFLGQGSAAGETAGHVRTPASLRVLVPRGVAPERLL